MKVQEAARILSIRRDGLARCSETVTEAYDMGINALMKISEVKPCYDPPAEPPKRDVCPLRHENGNCLCVGGFCTAVNDQVCRAVRSAYSKGVMAWNS